MIRWRTIFAGIFFVVISIVSSWAPRCSRMGGILHRMPSKVSPTIVFAHRNALQLHMTSTDISPLDENSIKDVKGRALYALDCLTSPRDTQDPEYDGDKDAYRDKLIASTNFADLKVELKKRNLKSKGDKEEMLVRLLVHIIDPSITLEESFGRKLDFVNASDIESKRIHLNSDEEIENIKTRLPDADDIQLQRRLGRAPVARVVMDGLTRRIHHCSSVYVQRAISQHNRPEALQSYIVSSKDRVRAFTGKSSSCILLLPSVADGWNSTAMRILADELAFLTQSMVILPDIDQKSLYNQRVFDHVISWLWYAAQKFRANSFAVLGCEEGADLALDVATKLHKIACLAVVDQSHSSPQAVMDVVRRANIYYRKGRRVLDFSSVDESGVEDSHAFFQNSAIMGNISASELQLNFTKEERDTLETNLRALTEELEEADSSSTTINETEASGTMTSSAQSVVFDSSDDDDMVLNNLDEVLLSDWNKIRDVASEVDRDSLVHARASLNATQLMPFRFRAVVAVSPRRAQHPSALASGLMVVDSLQQDSVQHLRDLKAHLDQHQNDLLDYSFRLYPAHVGFFSHPQSDLDKKCRQDAVEISSMWLDALMAEEADMVDGIGTMKTTEGGWTEIAESSMDLPLRSLGVATHLHEDPAFHIEHIMK